MVPDALAHDVSQGRTIIYLGAGFSAACGMPGWGELLKSMIADAEKSNVGAAPSTHDDRANLLSSSKAALAQHRFASCASLIRRLLTSSRIRAAVKHSFRPDIYREATNAQRERMRRRCLNVFRTPFRGVITTNYDTIFEDLSVSVAPRRYNTVQGASDHLGEILCNSSIVHPFLFKAHGSLDSDEIVLSTEEYDRIYLSNSTTRRFLEATMLASSLLFVGCSLEDELVRIRRNLMLEFGGKLPTSFVLVESNPENEARAHWLMDSCGIQSIFYANKNGSHSKVDDFLDELCGRSNDRAKQAFGVGLTATVKEHVNRDIAERLKHIGEENLDILRFIRAHAGKIDDSILLSLSNAPSSFDGFDFSESSPAEFFYRLMFLIQIALIKEERDKAGRLFYSLENGVARCLPTPPDPGNGSQRDQHEAAAEAASPKKERVDRKARAPKRVHVASP